MQAYDTFEHAAREGALKVIVSNDARGCGRTAEVGPGNPYQQTIESENVASPVKHVVARQPRLHDRRAERPHHHDVC
jgi:hypothetical protein